MLITTNNNFASPLLSLKKQKSVAVRCSQRNSTNLYVQETVKPQGVNNMTVNIILVWKKSLPNLFCVKLYLVLLDIKS